MLNFLVRVERFGSRREGDMFYLLYVRMLPKKTENREHSNAWNSRVRMSSFSLVDRCVSPSRYRRHRIREIDVQLRKSIN